MGVFDMNSRCITKSPVSGIGRGFYFSKISVVKTKVKGYFSRKAISLRENCNSPGKMLGHGGRNRWEASMWDQERRHWQQRGQMSAEREARKALRKHCSKAFVSNSLTPHFKEKYLVCWIVYFQINFGDFCWKDMLSDKVVWECIIKYKS